MMFQSDQQRAAVCRALLASLRLDHLWEDGPTDQAIELLHDKGGYLSTGERVMFLLAWSIWNNDLSLRFAELHRLDSQRLKLLGDLLSALSDGRVDEWLRSVS